MIVGFKFKGTGNIYMPYSSSSEKIRFGFDRASTPVGSVLQLLQIKRGRLMPPNIELGEIDVILELLFGVKFISINHKHDKSSFL